MTLLSCISAFCTSISLVIGSLVLRENISSVQNRLFALLCFCVGSISFVEFGYRQSESPSTAQFWFSLLIVTPILIPLMLHYIFHYTNAIKYLINKVIVYGSYALAVFFIAVDYFSGQISGAPNRSVFGWDHNMVSGTGYQLYTSWALVNYAILTFAIIRYYLKVSQPLEKTRAKYTMYSFLIVSLLAVTTDKIFPVVEFEFPELTTLGFVIANTLIGYAMWKYRLFRLSPVTAADKIVETISDALLLIDSAGNIVTVNSAAVKMFDCSTNYLVGCSASKLFSDETVYTQFVQLTDNWTKPLFDFSIYLKTAGDIEIPVSMSTSILSDSTGHAAGTVLIARNISERIEAQKALQEANELLEKRVSERTAELAMSNAALSRERDRLDITLKSIGDGVIVMSSDGTIELVNDNAEVITGCISTQVKGCEIRTVYNVKPIDARIDKFDPVGDAIRLGKRIEHNAIFVKNGAECCRVEGCTAPIRDVTGNIIGCVLVFRDSTEKYEIQRELFKIRRLESVSSLAGGIASDFESLLKSIVHNMFMIKLLANNNEDTIKLINDTECMALDAQSQVKKLSVFSGASNVSAQGKVESLSDLIRDSIGYMIHGESVDYELLFDDNLMNIHVEKGNIQTVLSNLVYNAEEAESSMITVEARNLLIDRPDHEVFNILKGHDLSQGAYVKVTVRDNGQGISEAVKEQAFDPFYSTKGQNRGLGLSVAYSIIKKLGGDIFFEPDSKSGCAVSFVIPATDESTSEQLTFSKNILLNEGNEFAGGNILFVHQNSALRTPISRVLSLAGFMVTETADIEQGIQLYQDAYNDNPFDSFICDTDDVLIGKLQPFLSRVKIINPSLKVIGIKRYSSSKNSSDPYKALFDSIVNSPVRMEELIRELKM